MRENKTDLIYSKYKNLINVSNVNELIEITGNQDIGKIKVQTIKNIAKWALNGASNEEIARNLEISDAQFQTLQALCPAIVNIMAESRELAEIVLTGSLFQRALGGQIIHKRVPVKVGDYEDGRKIGEHIEIVETEEELPPDSNLLKFLAEHKLSEKFGKDTSDKDKEIAGVVHSLDATQLKELEELIKNGK